MLRVSRTHPFIARRIRPRTSSARDALRVADTQPASLVLLFQWRYRG